MIKNNSSAEAAWLQLMKSRSGRELAQLCYYDWDYLRACHNFRNSEEWRAISRIVNGLKIRGSTALDLGAGNGIGSYALAMEGFNVIAVEPDSSDLVGYGALLEVIKNTSLPIKIVNATGEGLPFESNKFSLVYARQVLHHAQDLYKMVKEISRVITPGGFLVASREHVVDDQNSLNEFVDRHPIHKFTGNENAFRLTDYMSAMERAGLKVKSVIGPWDSVINHYPVSNNDLLVEMKDVFGSRLGIALGSLLIGFPGVKRLYRLIKSTHDHTPGRMYTFIAFA